jgi:hypothetical protein
MVIQHEDEGKYDDDEPFLKDGEPLDSDSEEEPKKKLTKILSH